MKYYISTIITTTSGAESRDTNYSFENYDDAVKRLHLIMGSNMGADGIAKVLVLLFNSDGMVMRTEKYEAPTTEATEETTEA